MTYVKRILFAVATFAVFASPATAKDPKDRTRPVVAALRIS
jgi:hypothetical protein